MKPTDLSQPPDSTHGSRQRVAAENEFVRHLAGSLLRDSFEAEDLAQETMLVALSRPPRFLSRAWLRRVVRTRAVNRLSSRDRGTATNQLAERASEDPDPAEVANVAEVANLLRAAVRELSPGHRVVITHLYFEGLSAREVARRLDLPLETVRTRRRMALARLREKLDARPGGRVQWLPALALLAHEEPASRTLVAGLTVTAALVVTVVGARLIAPESSRWADVARPGPGVAGQAASEGRDLRAPFEAGDPLVAPKRSSLAASVLAGTGPEPFAEEPAGAELILRGKVTDEDGRPVRAARVFASSGTDFVVFALTDERGEYEGSLPAGKDWVGCSAEGYGISNGMHRSDPRLASGGRVGRDFVLRRPGPGEIAGVVRDEQGNPVPGAEVRLLPALENKQILIRSRPLTPPLALPPVVSGEAGRFSLERPRERSLALQVSAPGHATVRSGVPRQLAERMELVLPPARTLSGSLSLPDGTPASGATVLVHDGQGGTHRANVDEIGGFILEGLPAKQVEIQAYLRDDAGTWAAEGTVALGSHLHRRWDGELAPGGRVHGVLLADDGEPCAGWRVSAHAAADGKRSTERLVTRPHVLAEGTTDRDGRFALFPLRQQEVALFATPPAARTPGLFVGKALPSSDPEELVVGPSRGTVEGKLIAPEDVLATSRLWIISQALARPRAVGVDERGRFSVSGVPAGRFGLVLWTLGRAPAELGSWELGEGEGLQLGSLAGALAQDLSVRLLDPAGHPVQARVNLLEAEGAAAGARLFVDFGRTDEDGLCTLVAARGPALLLEVGGVRKASVLRPVPVDALESGEDLTVVLPATRSCELAVRLPRRVEEVDSWRLTLHDDEGRMRILQVRPYHRVPEKLVSFPLELPEGAYRIRGELGSLVRDLGELVVVDGTEPVMELSFDAPVQR